MPAVPVSDVQLAYLRTQGISADVARAQAASGIDPCRLLIGPARAICESLTGGTGRDDPSLTLPNPFDVAGDLVGVLQQTLAFVAKAAAWISNPDNWIRILKVQLGAALIIGGLVIAARPAIKGTAGIVPAGKIASAVT